MRIFGGIIPSPCCKLHPQNETGKPPSSISTWKLFLTQSGKWREAQRHTHCIGHFTGLGDKITEGNGVCFGSWNLHSCRAWQISQRQGHSACHIWESRETKQELLFLTSLAPVFPPFPRKASLEMPTTS